jgi:hypothetical protein
MISAKPELSLEDVLLAFAVEQSHDKATLEQYLALYPQFAGDLIDMSHELRLPGRGLSDAAEDEANFQRAWKEFAGTVPRDHSVSGAANPFSAFRGLAFVALAKTLRVPNSVLIAFRDRLVIVSTVPEIFLARVARVVHSTVADISAYLERPSVVAAGVSYKSDDKPAALEKVAFETLLDASGVTAEQKADIFTAKE